MGAMSFVLVYTLGTFAANLGMLMTSIAWHEGLHAGQLTVVRKSLGLAPNS